ncbi:MAG: hypothetical protein AB7V23_12885, partial [Candidatus Nanopelagicales bacterium]
DSYWPIMADCERGLGRPERAITMAGAPEVDRLDRDGRVEMRIVASGARRDLGQLDAAVVTLQCPELSSTSTESWSARIKFAYADALLAAAREDEAREWFAQAVQADVADETDAAERLADLDGLVWVDALDGEDLDEDTVDEETADEDDDVIAELEDEVAELAGRVEALEEALEGEDGLDDGSEPLESELDDASLADLDPEEELAELLGETEGDDRA